MLSESCEELTLLTPVRSEAVKLLPIQNTSRDVPSQEGGVDCRLHASFGSALRKCERRLPRKWPL